MEIAIERRNGVLLAIPHGSLNTPSAAGFRRRMFEAIRESDRVAVVDLSQSPYISSSGLKALLALSGEFQARNGGLAVCSLAELARDIFRISGVDTVIPVYESQDDVLAAFGE